MKKNSIAEKLNSTIKVEVEKVLPTKDKFDFADTVLNKTELQDQSNKAGKNINKPQTKMVGFTFTENDIDLLQQVKYRCWDLKIYVNRSEILRAATLLISELDDNKLAEVCKRIEKLVPGRRKSIKIK